MAAARSVLDEIDGIVAAADKRRRIAMLRQITNLFVDKAALLDENLIGAFDEVILRLSRDLEFNVRVALSERFADFPRAPRRVVRDLAFDDNYGIAAPVLERSPRIEEGDLVEIVEQKSPMHVLAVSRRSSVSERLSDCIIARGFADAIRSLAINDGACLSEEAFAKLMQRSRSDPEMQDALHHRAELTPKQIEIMAEDARERVRATLADELGERMEQAIDAVVNDLTRKFMPDRGRELLPADLEVSCQFVATRSREHKIEEAEIVQWIKRNRLEDVMATLALQAEIGVDRVVNAFYAPNHDAFLFIARAVGLSWTTFKALLAKRSGRPPPLETLESAYKVFQKLKPETAKRVLRYAVTRGRSVPAVGKRPPEGGNAAAAGGKIAPQGNVPQGQKSPQRKVAPQGKVASQIKRLVGKPPGGSGKPPAPAK